MRDETAKTVRQRSRLDGLTDELREINGALQNQIGQADRILMALRGHGLESDTQEPAVEPKVLGSIGQLTTTIKETNSAVCALQNVLAEISEQVGGVG